SYGTRVRGKGNRRLSHERHAWETKGTREGNRLFQMHGLRNDGFRRSRTEGEGNNMNMTSKTTVRNVTYDLLRSLGLTTVFGNPGSTEETFLQDFPDDFTYVLGLQEASVMAMADGFAQSTGKPALVNVHTGAGTGNSLGSLVAAYRANTPLIVTAGQQTREMSIVDPYLNNPDPTVMVQPWVKWAYEPAR